MIGNSEIDDLILAIDFFIGFHNQNRIIGSCDAGRRIRALGLITPKAK